MERVKPGLAKKLVHRWHRPFRVKKKVEEFAYKLELLDKSGYRFYPVVHASRLKAVTGLGERLKTRQTAELEGFQRFGFDEEPLPKDSWEPDMNAHQYEVEATLDDELPLSTSTSRSQRKSKVKWVGYDDPTWEPFSNRLAEDSWLTTYNEINVKPVSKGCKLYMRTKSNCTKEVTSTPQ
ncbi:hypothetical protein PC128_g23225 [Phytophthora cactorum]|nr:hypothetical protein PC128_g23225 [Phytophthora cactorum]